jgi:hypothetical protein
MRLRASALSLGIAAALLFHGQIRTTAAPQDGFFMSSEATAPIPVALPALRGRSFVPMHSTVIAGGGATQLNFSGSLSIHNTSAKHVLIIDAIEYRDASGRLVENYAREKIGLRPFASIQVPIAQEDTRGGIGPSFVVDWSSFETAEEPAVEAVMIATLGTQGYAFVSIARRISRP